MTPVNGKIMPIWRYSAVKVAERQNLFHKIYIHKNSWYDVKNGRTLEEEVYNGLRGIRNE